MRWTAGKIFVNMLWNNARKILLYTRLGVIMKIQSSFKNSCNKGFSSQDALKFNEI